MGKVLYNYQIAKAIRNVKKPVKDLQLDIMLRPNYLALVVYEDNVMQYNNYKTEEIMAYLFLLRDVVRSFGGECEIEGFKTRPKEGFGLGLK